MAQQISPTIRCNRRAEEAGQFYERAFTEAGFTATSQVRARSSASEVAHPEESAAAEQLGVDVTINDYTLRLLDAGDEFEPGVAISFMVNFDPLFFEGEEASTRAALDTLWEILNDGGTLRMPLAEYPFSPHYGWIEDRFGVNWQLMLTNPSGDARPVLLPSLMFSGPWQGKAEEAVDFYLEIFPGSSLGNRVHYHSPTATARAGEVMFSDFQLLDQWFVAMDAGAPVPPFGPSLGFQIEHQATPEFDRLHALLNAHPEGKAGDWFTDPYGISWQIVLA